ncbi:MAG: uroporphyrinogen-III synthase [Porticoccaceae bacterium]|nr:uroporphyrinogen-III synthase [Porticoccaceae bacterium]MDG1474441.1 uroporphyrinogen-III synthase [Porticoccaceae bacterium]
MDKRLLGKNVLVIRSHRDNDDLMALIDQSQATLTYTPVIDIQKVADTHKLRDQILAFDQFNIAIFVSVHAATIGLDWLDSYWPMLPQGLTYFSIGRQTSMTLKDHVSSIVYPNTNATSEGLLALPQLQKINGQNVVIFRGSAGRETIKDALTARGATVEYCDVYHRVVNPQQVLLAQQQMHKTDVLVAHSGELLQAIGPLKMLRPSLYENSFTVIVPSQRIAEIAYDLGYGLVKVADNALPESMFAALVDCI